MSRQAVHDALERVGLRRLAPMLDRTSRWDSELNWDDQQSLMLARLLIHPAVRFRGNSYIRVPVGDPLELQFDIVRCLQAFVRILCETGTY